METLLLHRHSGFVRDVDIMWTLDEMDNDPSFRDPLRPRGLGWCGGLLVQVPGDDMLSFIRVLHLFSELQDALTLAQHSPAQECK